MENITIGQISVAIAFVVALITGVKYLIAEVKKALDIALKPTNDKIDKLDHKIDKVDKNSTMNYLVRCIDDIEHGKKLDRASKQRFYDQLEHYFKDLKGNSYIEVEVNRLEKENKL